MQIYEGYFEKDQFYSAGLTAQIPERKRAFVMILDEPVQKVNITKQVAEFDRFVDESSDKMLLEEDFPRMDFKRKFITFNDEV